jgi:hypothetical protein
LAAERRSVIPKAMQEALHNSEPAKKENRSIVTLIVAGAVAGTIVLSVWSLLRMQQVENTPQLKDTIQLKMGAAEQDYAKNIRIEKIALSRAENFLHQEVTILAADAVNSGSKPIEALYVTVEFSDELKQVVLRETRSVLGTPRPPLAPGARRTFEISFEHVPVSWNMQQPAVYVAYLQLSGSK